MWKNFLNFFSQFQFRLNERLKIFETDFNETIKETDDKIKRAKKNNVRTQTHEKQKHWYQFSRTIMFSKTCGNVKCQKIKSLVFYAPNSPHMITPIA